MMLDHELFGEVCDNLVDEECSLLVKVLGQPNLVVLFSMRNIIAVSDEQSVVRVASVTNTVPASIRVNSHGKHTPFVLVDISNMNTTISIGYNSNTYLLHSFKLLISSQSLYVLLAH